MAGQAATPLQIKNLNVRRSADFRLRVSQLSVKRGQVVCITGANGSGKTTLVESVVGLITPEGGSIKIDGQTVTPDGLATKRALGYIPDDDNWIIPELTATEYFDTLASVYERVGCQRSTMDKNIIQLAKKLNFSSFERQLGVLSHGNKKKVQIIAALLHEPIVLVVDELRNGLDPVAIRHAELILKAAVQKGTAVLAATHDLWWAERFADVIIMINNGELVFEEPTRQIRSRFGSLEAKFMEEYEKLAVAK